MAQVEFLDWIASREVPKAEITLAELEEKEAFRKQLEGVMKEAVAQRDSGDMATLSLVGFGSLASGFATPGSDMDLAIVPIWKDKSSGMQKYEIDGDIPRLLEKAVLESKMGGRLLTRTRVPILKVCQRPTEKLYTALYDERIKWDNLSDEEKYPSDNPSQVPKDPAEVAEPPESAKLPLLNAIDDKRSPETAQHSKVDGSTETKSEPTINIESSEYSRSSGLKTSDSKQSSLLTSVESASLQLTVNDVKEQQEQKDPKEQNDLKRPERRWAREKVLGPLDFPKSGIGIQCDINFSNPLGIHNTHLLRCYSLCDPRVRPMVLFVKSWAKRRQINSSYSGTLSSYGWVLMVLHYLINIVQPPVCPNLQLSWRAPTNLEELEKMFKETMIGGYPVRFWRDEQAITQSAQRGMLTRNKHSLGALLRGFFQYYATPFHGSHYGPRPPSFYWTNEVLSLRTLGGVRSKQEKGWTGAKTTIAGGKEVRNRYLFAIEDPFEIDHNVARTVTHHGIVAIRDEFRRAWRIVSAVGKNQQPEGDLFDEVVDKPPPMPQKVEEKEVGMDNINLATLETRAVDGDAAQNVSELQD
jgi:terminal uridylyltransferase